MQYSEYKVLYLVPIRRRMILTHKLFTRSYENATSQCRRRIIHLVQPKARSKNIFIAFELVSYARSRPVEKAIARIVDSDQCFQGLAWCISYQTQRCCIGVCEFTIRPLRRWIIVLIPKYWMNIDTCFAKKCTWFVHLQQQVQ